MNQFCNEELKKRIVTAIKDGLASTIDEYRSNRPLKFSKNFRKVENVGNSVIKMIETIYDGEYEVPILMRGNYPVFSIYHADTKTLVGVMSKGCRERVFNRKSKNPHYLNALVGINSKHKLEPLAGQMSIGDLTTYSKDKTEPIRIKMKDQIDGVEPEYYFTILYDMDGYTLTSVEMVLLTEELQEVFREDWSDYIEIDYHNSYDEEHESSDPYNMLKISVKENKINKGSSDLEENLMKEKKKKKSLEE